MHLTDEQLIAVKENSMSICISAGAGSGKTRVLVEKFWQLIESGFEIDEILAMTFTRKAAWEMIERIRHRVDQSHLDPDRKRSLKEGLNNAWIGTIDGICSRIIRDYPIEAGIDPGFEIADDTAVSQLRYEIARDIVLNKIEANDSAVLEYIKTFGYYRILDDMQTLLAIITRRGLSLEAVRKVTWASIDNVESNLRNLADNIEEAYDAVIACLPNLNKKTQTYAKIAQMAEDKEVWLRVVRNVSSLNFNEAEWQALQHLHDLGKGNHAKDVKELFNLLRALIAQLQGSIIDINNRSYLGTLFELTELLNAELRAVKAERNLLEFADLEDKAIEVLKNYPKILSQFQKQFKHIMVDEFQDTNYRQVELVNLLSGHYKNCVFVVGDPKQSIYRFRGAQVNLFTEINNKISHIGGLSHQLSKNFRTKSTLIGFINSVFEYLMRDSRDFTFQSLVAARLSESNEHTELHLLKADDDLELDPDEAEAYIIAQRIKEMVDNEEKLVYEDTARAVRYSDIAILFQKAKTMDLFTSVLMEYNIPYFVVGSQGFFDTEEVNTLILALKVIDNYNDEFAWVGVLRSPMFGVSDEALWYLKQKYRYISKALINLEESKTEIKSTDYEALLLARRMIDDIAANKSRLSMEEIITKILEGSNYDLFLSCQPNGEQKLANIKKLIEMADRETIEAYNLVRDFLIYVQKAKNSSSADEQQAVIDSEAGNTVKLMTVHQSKGLEFPVVILPHIHQLFNTSDATDKLVFCDNLGVFINTDPKGFLRVKAQEEEKDLIIEEYKRLFYVAQTRARDYLIMSGSYKENEKINYDKDPKCWLDWILRYYQVTDYSLLENLQPDGLRKVIYDKESIDLIKKKLTPNSDEFSINNLSSYEYKMPLNQDRYEYISATRLMDYQFCPFYTYLKHNQGLIINHGTDEIGEVEVLDAANVGSIIHKIIEQTDNLSEAKEKLKAVLTDSKHSAAAEQMDLFYEMLENYYEHELIKELSTKSRVLKEVPFLVRIEDKIFLNGVIDQLWLSNDFYHVLDLKTGRTDFDNENYHLQLNLYKLALDKVISQKIGKKGIFYLRSGEIRDAKDMDIDFNFNNKPSPVKTSNCSICDNKYICFPNLEKEAL